MVTSSVSESEKVKGFSGPMPEKQIWWRWLAGKLGSWPRNLLCFDIECCSSTGRIVQWGHCLVINGSIRDRMLLEWAWPDRRSDPSLLSVPDDCYVCLPAETAAKNVHRWLVEASSRNLYVVFHNGVKYDLPFLKSQLSVFGLTIPDAWDDYCLDTAALEKAQYVVMDERSSPRPGDTLSSFFQRILSIPAKGCYFSLERCWVKYAAEMKAAGVPYKNLHRADVDALAAKVVLDVWRRCITFDCSRSAPGPEFEDDGEIKTRIRVRSQRR